VQSLAPLVLEQLALGGELWWAWLEWPLLVRYYFDGNASSAW